MTRINFKQVAIFGLLAMLCLQFSSCTIFIGAAIAKGVAKRNITVEKGAIPPDFGKSKHTLMAVKTGKNSYDKYLIKNFEKYQGEYVIINPEDTESSAYADLEKYRYRFEFLFEEHGLLNAPGPNASSSNNTATVRRFLIYDRLKDEVYASRITSSFYSKVMKAYIENLNAELEKSI